MDITLTFNDSLLELEKAAALINDAIARHTAPTTVLATQIERVDVGVIVPALAEEQGAIVRNLDANTFAEFGLPQLQSEQRVPNITPEEPVLDDDALAAKEAEIMALANTPTLPTNDAADAPTVAPKSTGKVASIWEERPAQTIDSDGLAWHEALHSGGKIMNVRSGLWKRKRGVSDEEYESFATKLRQVQESVSPQPTQPTLPFAEYAPQEEVEKRGVSFPEFLSKYTERQINGLFGPTFAAGALQILAKHNITALPMVAADPSKLALIDEELDALWSTITAANPSA